MTMTIYTSEGIQILDAIVTSAARHEQELMKSDFIALEWNDDTYRSLPSGAYIMPFGDQEGDPHYTLYADYEPENNNGVYVYKPEFQAPCMILAHTPCLFLTNNSQGQPIKQVDWVYTGNLQLIVGHITTIIFEELAKHLEAVIKIKSTTSLPASATCTFSGVDIMSALNEICSQFGGLDWHVDWEGGLLYIGDVTAGGDEYVIDPEAGKLVPRQDGGTTPAQLTEGDNVQFASVNRNGQPFANYFIVRGGTRNITVQTQSGNHVQTDTRLELDPTLYPNSVMDNRTDKQHEPKVQKILIFDNVYPHLNLYAYNIRKRTRILKDEKTGAYVPKSYNQDGTVKEFKTYSIYYMRLAYPTNEAMTTWEDYRIQDPKTAIMNGRKLTCSFEPNEDGTHSALAGREFELAYHQTNQSYTDIDSKVPNTLPLKEDTGVEIDEGDYEIVFTEDNEMIIPNDDTLEPWGMETPNKVNDIVVLFNIVMDDTYISKAQQDLKTAAQNEIARILTDDNNYTVKSNPVAFNTSNPNLTIGSSVDLTLQNGTVMNTRVIKLVTNIDYPCQQEITVGNAVIKGSTQVLKEDVKTLTAAIDINENSATTINKMISQLYRLMREYDTIFLHKNNNDETPWTLGAHTLVALVNAIMKGDLKTEHYNKSMVGDGTGWGVDHEGNMQVESLEVRSALRVLELVYNRLSAEESDYIFTEAGTIKSVTPTSTANQYTVEIEKRSDTDFHAFQVGDILKGVVNDLTNLGGGSYYTCWLEVVATDTSIDQETSIRNNSVTVNMYADTDCPGGTNYQPQERMVVHRWGNNLDATAQNHSRYPSVVVINPDGTYTNRRQSCWYISSTEKRIMYLDHVDKPIISEVNYAAFFGLPVNIPSFKGHSLDETQPYLYCRGAFLQDLHFINYLGKEYKVERDRGEWSAETAASQDDPYIVDYAVYQTVTHNNCKWECVSQVPAVYEPSKVNTSEWKLLKENLEPSVYTLITNVKTVTRDAEGTPNVDVVKCKVRKTQNDETTDDTQDQLGYLYYSVNGENMRRGNEVEIEANDGIKKIRFVFYPKKTEELGGTRLGEGKFGTSMIEAVVDVIDGARRGAILRGPSEWKDNVEYMGGGEGEDYQDIVVRTVNGVSEFFLCHFTHTGVDPHDSNHQATSGWDINAPWEKSQASDFVATKVLFAERSIIKNLALNEAAAYPRVKDEQGHYTDQLDTEATPTVSVDGDTGLITANGGVFNDITANRGTFNNITVNRNSLFYGILKASVIQTEAHALYYDGAFYDIDLLNNPHTRYDVSYDTTVLQTPPNAHLPYPGFYEGLELEFTSHEKTNYRPCFLECNGGQFRMYYKGKFRYFAGLIVWGYVKVKALGESWDITIHYGPLGVGIEESGSITYLGNIECNVVPAVPRQRYDISIYNDVIIDGGFGTPYFLPDAQNVPYSTIKIFFRGGSAYTVTNPYSNIIDFDGNILNHPNAQITRSIPVALWSDGADWYEMNLSN